MWAERTPVLAVSDGFANPLGPRFEILSNQCPERSPSNVISALRPTADIGARSRAPLMVVPSRRSFLSVLPLRSIL